MQNHKNTDRNKNNYSKPKQHNGFVKEEQYVPSKIPQVQRKTKGGFYNYQQENQADYEEEKTLNNRQPQYNNSKGGNDRFQENFDAYPQHFKSQPDKSYSNKGGQQTIKSQGAGQGPRVNELKDPVGFFKRAPFEVRGRGRGRGANLHQTRDRDFNNGVSFGQPIDFEETKQRTRGRGQKFQPLNHKNQWVRNDPYYDEENDDYEEGDDYSNSRGGYLIYNRNNQYYKEDVYDNDDTIYEQRGQQTNYEFMNRDKNNNDQSSKYIHLLANQEMVTHNKKIVLHQKQLLYKDYLKSEFYQGPIYDIYRNLTHNNRKQRIQSSELHDIHFQQKHQYQLDQQNPPQLHHHQFQVQNNHNIQPKKDKDTNNKKHHNNREPFDLKKEKRIENKFWNEEKNSTSNNIIQATNNKQSKITIANSGNHNNRGLQKRQLLKKAKKSPMKPTPLGRIAEHNHHHHGMNAKGSKRLPKKTTQNNKFNEQINDKQQRGVDKQKRQCYEEYLNEESIKKGLANGTLFEGILRVSQNNRRRAFVTINDITVDVMVDGLQQQNRAFDGDTVIIELLEPSKWTEYVSNNIVIGKNSLGQGKLINQIKTQGYTNETAVETRIVDLEVFDDGKHGDENDDTKELKEVRKEFIRQNKSEETKGEMNNNPESLIFNNSKEHNLSDSEDDEDVGYGFIDDEQVSSSNDDNDDANKKVEHESDEDNEEEEEEVKEEKHNTQDKQGKQQMVYRIKKPESIQGKTKQERVAEINKIAKDLRPMGKVKFIIKSPNREKEHLVTLMPLEKSLLDEKNIENFIEIYKEKKNAASSGIYAVPVSKKLPWMAIFNIPQEFIDDLKAKKKPNQRYYIAKFQNWKASTIRPACNIVSSIGEAGNLDAESLRILKSHDIWSDEYETEGQKISEKVHESLRIFTKDIDEVTGEWKIHDEELKRRVDLRNKRIFTIDPITAKDLDDALSIDKVSDFIYEIGVHIADVSYFVQQGTDLDKEAQLRCTSVYFVHKVYPMLPRLLCERLCSLNPKVDRLAYSIFFRMDIRNGEIDRSFTPKIARTVIRSCAKWNYQLVQDILDGNITNESQLSPEYQPINGVKFSDMRNDCFLMNEIAQKRRKKRLENGSILLQNREFIFVLDQDSRMPMSFQESYRIESKFLVEEYMLLANILIAEHLYQYCKDKTLLRCHPDLDNDKKDKLRIFFDKVGLQDIDLTDSKSLSVSLENLREQGDSAKFNVAMRKFLTCLQCAKYMCINQSEPLEYQHFGLNFPLYTHFTSPIRRYADLLVHRLVTLTLQHKEATRDLIELMDYSNYAELCSEKSYNAKRASQQCSRLFHCLLLKSQGVKVFETLLFDMDQGSISIYIDEVNMHQKLRLRDDSRIDSILFFEEQLTIVAHIKNKKEKGKEEEKREKFKQIKTLSEFKQYFSPEEFLIMRIFDKIKVKVETTTEFPLDIKCTLMFTQEDTEEFDKLLREQESKNLGSSSSMGIEIAMEEMENLNDEV